MKHKLSFIVLGDSGLNIKQINLSRIQIVSMVVVTAVFLMITAYGTIDYFSLHSKLKEQNDMERRLNAQGEEVLLQRSQIQKFAQEINQLKESLVTLNKFTEQVRDIANINQPDGLDSLFGVGGSPPEDLMPSADLHQSHLPLMKQMHQQIKQLNDAAQKQENTFSHLLDKLEEQKNMLAHTPTIRPAAGWVSSTFAYRQSPFTGRREFHKGLDIANKKGTPIVATADGVVSFSGINGGFGNVIVIDHGYGFVTRYGHLEKSLKKRGERVKRGEVIALMGNTGRSTGSHVHYEVRLNGVQVNPQKYILN